MDDPELGRCVFRGRRWVCASRDRAGNELLIGLPGDRRAPALAGLSEARALLGQVEAIAASALKYADDDASVQAFIASEGALQLDGFSVTDEPGTFVVEFSVQGWPDAMIDVQFRAGLPCGVSCAD
ncbi:hypothetical protein [Pseudoxanthomonas sp. GM95]|uniref:hypothetical protein n=1 Tax=Pseudoxanthomonas sp. GM95 TaxID=1881043 RepID=UPI001113E3A6|nr:hypothetical protein [Pseudoxanthomonas sp. GM95]